MKEQPLNAVACTSKILTIGYSVVWRGRQPRALRKKAPAKNNVLCRMAGTPTTYTRINLI